MNNTTKAFLLLPAILTGFLVSAQAQVVWDGSGDGTTWGDDSNWVGNAQPTSSSTVDLGGNTIIVNTLTATYVSNVSGSAGAVININSGGTLTAVGGNFNTLRYLSAVNVNDGGSYVDANASTTVRTNVTIASGGTVTGLLNIRDGKILTIGGLWQPLDGVDGSNSFSWLAGGTVDLVAGGQIELDLFGNNTNENFNVNQSLAVLNLSAGSIKLVAQGGYVPQIGDSFDLWENPGGGTINPGDGSNISISGFNLDVSTYATDGVVTLTAVPEPATIALLLGIGALGAVVLSRRRRSVA